MPTLWLLLCCLSLAGAKDIIVKDLAKLQDFYSSKDGQCGLFVLFVLP